MTSPLMPLVKRVGPKTAAADPDGPVNARLKELLANRATAPRLARLDASLSSRLLAASYTAPDNASINAAAVDADAVATVVTSGTHGNAALKALIDPLPKVAPTLIEANSSLALSSSYQEILSVASGGRMKFSHFTNSTGFGWRLRATIDGTHYYSEALNAGYMLAAPWSTADDPTYSGVFTTTNKGCRLSWKSSFALALKHVGTATTVTYKLYGQREA